MTDASSIVFLPDDLASQIAAGEVVERPASVVKELVENALDAGASRVDVGIEGGGISAIRVSDDGHGMTVTDAPLCLGRHATSKLRRFSDLERLSSYGFRGEALPSVASVSRLTLRTRHQSSDSGVLLQAEGSTEGSTRPVGSPVGTAIEVRDLFFNVPARRKFLRSSNTESGHVTEVVVDAALGRPEVSFTLRRDGRRTKDFERVESFGARAAQVFSGEELTECSGIRGPLQVQAFLCGAHRARKGASGLKMFVNGRPVRNRALSATIAHALGESLERGYYPRGVVYLTLSERLVDVNVHPQKIEVRFADPRAVADALHSIVRQGLADPVSSESAGAPQGIPSQLPAAVDSAARPSRGARGEEARPMSVLRDGKPPVSGARYVARGPASDLAASVDEPQRAQANWKGLRLLSMASGRYLVCEGDDGIFVLDQHAAQERVLLSQLRRELSSARLSQKPLLFPESLALDGRQIELLEPWGHVMRRLGLDVRVRGEQSVSIHGAPSFLSRTTPSEFLLSLLSEFEKTKAPEEADLGALLPQFACREAIAPGERMQKETAQRLLRQLLDVDFEVRCVHGRVILSELPLSELERKAGRR